MKIIKRFVLFCFLFITYYAMGQTVSLNPASISPSSYNVDVITAGVKPVDLLNNYTGQQVKYTWPFLGDSFYGYLYAKVTGLPPGFKMTVLATGSAGFWSLNGTSTGTITLSTTDQVLIQKIVSSSNVSRGLTQDIDIDDSNFASLKAGNKIVTVTYSLY